NLAAGDRKATAMSIFGVGGTLGFALGPAFMTAALINLGLKGTLVLIVPVLTLALIIISQQPFLAGLEKARMENSPKTGQEDLKDAWWPFTRLTVTVLCRSILFYGLNTFIPLYWINGLGRSEAAGATALTVMALSNVAGNLLGGRMADRFGHRRMILLGFLILIPLLPLFAFTKAPLPAMALLVPIGMALATTYSPSVVLGQRYLPNRLGLSSGVTLGVAVSVGGVSTPFLGMIADAHGIGAVLAAISILPLVGCGVTWSLPRPGSG
ncbi:MAG: MFS transporter, partial [Desulfobacterales bacterium]|nr:MFS transporter [Desulfobacterales bacterium]